MSMEQKIKQAEDIARRILAGDGIQEGVSEGTSGISEAIPTAADMRGFAQTRAMFDKRAMWRNIARRTRPHRQRDYWWVAAASVVAIVGGWLTGIHRQGQNVETPPTANVATLVLDDGQRIAIVSDTVFTIGGSQVAIGGGRMRQVSSVDAAPAENLTVQVPRGAATLELELSDGSTVWLNADSELRYPSRFADERMVELTGEAFFDVERDELHPFVVRSGAMRTTVLGTTFNISAYADDHEVRTTLVSGSVLVEVEGGASQVLSPSMQAIFSGGGLMTQRVDTVAETSWMQGIMTLKETSLVEIARTLGRWHNLEVEFVGGYVGEHNFTGSIARTDDVSAVLEKLTLLGAPKLEIRDNKIIVH